MSEEQPQEQINKRLAAMEVHKHLKNMYVLSLMGIGAVIVVGITFALNSTAGMIGIGGASMLFIYHIYKSRMEMQRLEIKYNIEPLALFTKKQ